MNKMKEELLKTAGDVSKSKQRVIVEVERRLEERKQKRSNKWVPVLMTAIIIICFILVSPKLLEKEVEKTGFSSIDEELVELASMRLMGYGWDEEYVEEDVRREYVNYILLQKYAVDHNIKVTKDDLEKARIDQVGIQMFEELEQHVIDYFDANDFTKKDYDKLLQQYLLPKAALKQKLLAPIAEKYPHFYEVTHDFVLTITVHEYLEKHYEDDYYALIDTHEVHSPLFGYSTEEGVVLQVTDEAVLFMNATFGFGSDDDSGIRWAARLHDWDVAVGDPVNIVYNTSYSHDDADKDGKYTNITHVKSMEKREDGAVRFEVTKEDLAYYMEPLHWQTSTSKPSTEPQFIVTDHLHVYKGYMSSDRGHVTWYYDGKETTLTTMKALNLLMNVKW